MPEYLAPGVYVEEFEIGARPIEGVSTSTAGFLGFAERGPLNKPVLVTSFADFERTFGGFLPAKKNGAILSKIRWLAYAVAGFFENGGKRAYVTRVAVTEAKAPATKAEKASGYLPKIVGADDTPKLGAKAVAEENGLEMAETTNFVAGDFLLLKDGGQSEYLKYEGLAKEIVFKAGAKLALDYAPCTTVLKGVKPANETTKLDLKADAAATELKLAAVDAVKAGDYLLVDDADSSEVVVIKDKNDEDKIITIESPLLFEHAKNVNVFILAMSDVFLIRNAKADDAKLYLAAKPELAQGDFLIIGSEYFEIDSAENAANVIDVTPALKYEHEPGKPLIKLVAAVKLEAANEGEWGNGAKFVVKPSSLSSTKLKKPAAANQDRLYLETVNNIEPGSLLSLAPDTAGTNYVTVKEVFKTTDESFVDLEADLKNNLELGTPVQTEEFSLIVLSGKNEEIFKSLSLNEKHSRYIKKIITEKSSTFIRIGDFEADPQNPQAIEDPPTQDGLPGWFLKGGDDGFPTDPTDDNQLNSIFEGKDSLEPEKRKGLQTFKNVDGINIVAMPGITSQYLQQKLITHCEIIMKDRFAVLDPIAKADLDAIQAQRNLFDSSYAALYYPWIRAFDPLTKEYANLPPSGHVCGIYAKTDVDRGVHKAPANETVVGAVNFEKLNGNYRLVNKGSQEILNPIGVNCIRVFPGRGVRVWGARTMSSNSLWKYINVRRLFLYLEESIEEGTQWVVFEPNDDKLWARVKQTITQFLTRVWRDGALMGLSAEEAFFVKCDRTTMTQDDIDNGRLIVVIGVSPVKPAEFVIFRIAQWTGGSDVSE